MSLKPRGLQSCTGLLAHCNFVKQSITIAKRAQLGTCLPQPDTSQEKRDHFSAQCLWLWFQFCCHCMCFSSSHPGWMVQPFHYVCKKRFTSSSLPWLSIATLKDQHEIQIQLVIAYFLSQERKWSLTSKKKRWSLELFHNIERFSTIISAWNKNSFFFSFVLKHTSNTH